MSYPGVYRAKCSAAGKVFIPQVFGKVQVPISGFVTSEPSPGDKGYVAFESGEAEYPVWLG